MAAYNDVLAFVYAHGQEIMLWQIGLAAVGVLVFCGGGR